MQLFSGIIEQCLGLCRRTPKVHTIQTGIGNSSESAYDDGPGGGSGGLGSIRRGVGAARSGLRTLLHNPRLLGFPLLVAFVLVGLLIIRGVSSIAFSSPQWVLFTDPYIAQWRFFADPTITRLWPDFYTGTSLLYSVILMFVTTIIVEFLTVFCLAFLLAGLVLALSQERHGPVSFSHGLAMAGKHLIPLAKFSVVVALAGTLLYIACQYSYLLGVNILQFLPAVFGQSPFNYVFTPNLANSLLPGGEFGISLSLGLSLICFYGLMETAILSAITVLLFILTLFVVLGIVIEKKCLKEALLGSCTLMWRIRGEVAACMLGLGTIVLTALLASLLFPIIAGGNIAVDYWPPPAEWLTAGLLYVLALSSLALIAATIGGIATLNLYTFAKTGHMPGSPEPDGHL